MTQAQLDRAVAQLTGESISTIRLRGFSIVTMPEQMEFEDSGSPQVVDWDALNEERLGVLPGRVC